MLVRYIFSILLILSCGVVSPAKVLAADPSSLPSGENTVQVEKIFFHGNKHIPAREIKEIMNTKEKGWNIFKKAPYSEMVFEEDLKRIERFFKSKGFYHAKIKDVKVHETDSKVVIEIWIKEGPPTIVKEINWDIKDHFPDPFKEALKELIPLKVGDIFTTEGYKNIKKSIVTFLLEHGYPKSVVNTKAFLNMSNNTAKIFIDLNSGPLCYIGDIKVEGNKKISTKIILEEIVIHKGDVYRESKIRESQRRLFNSQLFTEVHITVEELDSKSNRLPVKISVKEGKKQTIKAGVGYGTEDDFRGQLTWTHRNFLGDARRLSITAKGSSLERKIELNFKQPHFLEPRMNFTFNSGYAYEDHEGFENQKYYDYFRLNKAVTNSLQGYIGYNFEVNEVLSIDISKIDEFKNDKENENYYISSIESGFNFIQVDNLTDPNRGMKLTGYVEYCSKVFGSDIDYVKIDVEGRFYYPIITNRLTLATRLRWGNLDSFESSKQIPIFKRFFSGGSYSVRGYPYERLGPLDEDGDPIGGNSLIEGNVELRFPLFDSLKGVCFTDFGNVYKDSLSIDFSKVRYTIGSGLRYMTPIGPIRVDMGYQLNPPDDFPYSRYHIHASIGHAF